eukprot:12887180-Alexandrium_andersonii.AAC.1
MLVYTLVCARHARIAQSLEQGLAPGAAFFRASGAGCRASPPYAAALQAPGRVAVLLEHLSLIHISEPTRLALI